jgi:predicted transcriptional regulator
MKPENSLFDAADPGSEAEADARADADERAGRFISHEAVKRWLASWGAGKPERRPRPGD